MENKIVSPCISICKTDPLTGYCYGCARTEEEKKIWKEESTENKWKINNLKEITSRMQGWQLSTFKESYQTLDRFCHFLKILAKFRQNFTKICPRNGKKCLKNAEI